MEEELEKIEVGAIFMVLDENDEEQERPSAWFVNC